MRRLSKTVLALTATSLFGCGTTPARVAQPDPKTETQPKEPPVSDRVSPEVTRALVEALVKQHGEGERARITRGVAQVAALWRGSDGDLTAFARERYIADPALREATFQRFQTNLEQIDGHLLEIGRELRRPSDLDLGDELPIDGMFAGFDVGAHVTEDLFSNKIAFVVLLNFELSTLAERLARAGTMTRRDWAEARLTARYDDRVPSAVQSTIARVGSEADAYIAGYNIWAHHALTADGKRLFPSGKKLITHWNLRDELKAQYPNGQPGLEAQRTLVRVMERIVTQTIPAAVIDNPHVDWNPFTNDVALAAAGTVEQDAPARETRDVNDLKAPEPDRRYAHLLAQFKAWSAADVHAPNTPTVIQRSFELGRELTEARVVGLLESVLASPRVAEVAAIIQARLGRALEPQDLWYDGFKPRSRITEAELDAKTKKRWPTPAAFEKELGPILEKLHFSKAQAKFLAAHIKVDPARGAGHAMQAARRGDFPRLRTRIGKDGMDYKGFNIAIHELGHNVEQVYSLYGVDHTLLAGVPNTAFTEALAFVFQQRDLEVLGVAGSSGGKADPKADADRVLADFWATWEIAGVALVDVAAWHWMYAHPNATPAELRDAVVAKAREVWAKYYAPVLGGVDGSGVATPLLGIYSHMIAYPLYLCDYPLGHLIAFQLEEHFAAAEKSGKTLGAEFERISRLGNIAPDVWMQQATGAPVSADALLAATERAVKVLASK